MNKTTKIDILAYASQPDKNYNYFGDTVEYKGKRYFVDLSEERVDFLGIVKEEECRMLESNKDKFIEEVKVLLSGNIADKNTVDYLSFKIGRLFVQYLDQYLMDMGNAGRGYVMTPDELKAALSNNTNDISKHLIGGGDNESD